MSIVLAGSLCAQHLSTLSRADIWSFLPSGGMDQDVRVWHLLKAETYNHHTAPSTQNLIKLTAIQIVTDGGA